MSRLANLQIEDNENEIADVDTILDDRTQPPPPPPPLPPSQPAPPHFAAPALVSRPGGSGVTIVPRARLTLPANVVSFFWSYASAFVDQIINVRRVQRQRGPMLRLGTHLIRNLVINHIPQAQRNTVVVLGAGGLRDIPIGMLLANFERVVLVDILYQDSRRQQMIRDEVRRRIGTRHRRFNTLDNHLRIVGADFSSSSSTVFQRLSYLQPNLVISSIVTTALYQHRQDDPTPPVQVVNAYINNLIELVQHNHGHLYYADTPSTTVVDDGGREVEIFPWDLDFAEIFRTLNSRLQNLQGNQLNHWQFAEAMSVSENINVLAGIYSHL